MDLGLKSHPKDWWSRGIEPATSCSPVRYPLSHEPASIYKLTFFNKIYFGFLFKYMIETVLELRQTPKYMGPELGSSLLAILQNVVLDQ